MTHCQDSCFRDGTKKMVAIGDHFFYVISGEDYFTMNFEDLLP